MFCTNCGEMLVAASQPAALTTKTNSRVGWGCLIAFLLFIAICALIALPDFLAERRRRREAPARVALQAILRAERRHAAGQHAFTCDIAELQRTNLNLASSLANAAAAGFRVELRDCRAPAAQYAGGFHAVALPSHAELHAWCADETGSVMRSYNNRAEGCPFASTQH